MKPIYFNIPYNGVKVSKRQYVIPQFSLPAKDWLNHNQINIKSINVQIVAFIRNPLERVIFQYLHQLRYRPALRQYPMSFEDWCIASFDNTKVDKFMQNNPKEFLLQKTWISDLIEVAAFSFATKENYKAIDGLKIAHISIEKYQTKITKELVEDWYYEDFEFLNELN
jgi:hypothetical protein